MSVLVSSITPGNLPPSAGSVSSLSITVGQYLSGPTPVLILEADANVTGVAGSDVFARITCPTTGGTVIATSQIELSGTTPAASMRCVGSFSVPTSAAATLAFELDMWTTGTASVSTSSSIFFMRTVP